ncbi:growth hormone secretagogue receptor type 1 isoform X1 [Brachionus plicatilis]|uniref:Growth hormone secretagogue receptor type 1 isoform X1 n=1 Tax=Brachionus plicatilis TaxID=10195 RepID=A0A3M7RAF4_BRAPC|nr:growth hormone secretagogue receptor type 1 isoform X1 [Brachionus plicatilis]
MENKSINVSSICLSDLRMPKDVIIYGSFFYSIIFSIGVIGNVMVIFFIVRKKEMRNFTFYLLANLSLADLMVLFSNVPSGLHDLFAKERWYLGKMWCHSVFFVENTMVFASILTIFLITYDRYYVICRPLHVKSVINSTRTFNLIIFLWTLSLIVNIPFIFFSEFKETKFFDCTIGYKCQLLFNSLFFYHIIITHFIIFFLLGMILLIMYLRIYSFLNKSNNFLTACWIENGLQTNLNTFSSDSNEYSLGKASNHVENLARSKNKKLFLENSKTTSELFSLKEKDGLRLNGKNYETIKNAHYRFAKNFKQRKNLISKDLSREDIWVFLIVERVIPGQLDQSKCFF